MSPDQSRALALLKAGALGGHAGALLAAAAFFWTRGPQSGISALVASAITLAFYIIGQAVQVRVADASPQRVLTAALVSYGVRVGALAALLALALTQRDRLVGMDPAAVVVGTLAVVVTWLAAEIIAFSRMQIPDYDPPSSKPGTSSAGRVGDC